MCHDLKPPDWPQGRLPHSHAHELASPGGGTVSVLLCRFDPISPQNEKRKEQQKRIRGKKRERAVDQQTLIKGRKRVCPSWDSDSAF